MQRLNNYSDRLNEIHAKMTIKNPNGNSNQPLEYELEEQLIAVQYIEPSDVVLELGANKGCNSCVINHLIGCSNKQLSIEPSPVLGNILNVNRDLSGCNFHIFNGTLSKEPQIFVGEGFAGYTLPEEYDFGFTVPHKTLGELKKETGIERFNCLVADCEGALPQILRDFPELYDECDKFLVEMDGTGLYGHELYDEMIKTLDEKGFVRIQSGFRSIWKRANIVGFNEGSCPLTTTGDGA